ncbi:MAG: hypothetical protein ACHQYQ_01150 [Bacteriovoracales bacterium]
MLAKKITYTGKFDSTSAETMLSIVRQIEMTGELKVKGPTSIELYLEGDLANITLILHQIKQKLKDQILDKTVERIPYQNYVGVTLIR